MEPERLPPGQRWIDQPIVYEIASPPTVRLAEYALRFVGAVDTPHRWTWGEILEMPCARIVRDFHCVTTWSVRNLAWEGVAARDLVARVGIASEVRWVLAQCLDGYDVSIPYAAFTHPDTLFAYRMNGQVLAQEHGYPVRLVVPSLYAWKSAKFVHTVSFHREPVRGFWEKRGYHDRGDPWNEERYRD